MSVLSILRVLAATASGPVDTASRLVSPDPKEVAVASGATGSIVLDLGASVSIGAVMLNAVSSNGYTFRVRAGNATGFENDLGLMVAANKRTSVAPFKYYTQFTPLSARYVTIVRDDGGAIGAGITIGNAIAAERFSPTWGHEWGAGRGLIDTGSANRNRAGGFGIENGAIVPTWDFTLGDLTDAEREVLFDMLRKIGETNPVVVAEDPDATTDLDARLHYGLFQRLEKYERQTVGVTRWSLKIEEWL